MCCQNDNSSCFVSLKHLPKSSSGWSNRGLTVPALASSYALVWGDQCRMYYWLSYPLKFYSTLACECFGVICVLLSDECLWSNYATECANKAIILLTVNFWALHTIPHESCCKLQVRRSSTTTRQRDHATAHLTRRGYVGKFLLGAVLFAFCGAGFSASEQNHARSAVAF